MPLPRTVQLKYLLAANPFPVQASPIGTSGSMAAVQIIATNPSSQPDTNPVMVLSLVITLPIGPASSDLSLTQPLDPLPPECWELSSITASSNSVAYEFKPEPDYPGIRSEAVIFSFYNIEVNDQPGVVQIGITQSGEACTPLQLSKFPSGFGTVTFNSCPSPPVVNYDGELTLLWSGPVGATYQLEYYTPATGLVVVPKEGQPPLPNSGSYPGPEQPPLRLEQDTTFYLQVSDRVGQQEYAARLELTATVVDPPPQIELFKAELTLNSDGLGWTIRFEWITQYAASTSLAGIAEGLPAQVPSYKLPVTPATIQAGYTLTAVAGELKTQSTVQLQLGQFAQFTIPGYLQPGNLGSTIAVTSNGTIIAVECDNGVLILARPSFREIEAIKVFPLSPVALMFTANDSLLFALGVADSGGTILAIYETTGWAQIATHSFPNAYTQLAVTADGLWGVAYDFLFCAVFQCGDHGQTISVINSQYRFPDATVYGVGIDRDGQQILMVTASSGDASPRMSICTPQTNPDSPLKVEGQVPLAISTVAVESTVDLRTCAGSQVLVMELDDRKLILDSTTYEVIDSPIAQIPWDTDLGMGRNPFLFYYPEPGTARMGVWGPISFTGGVSPSFSGQRKERQF